MTFRLLRCFFYVGLYFVSFCHSFLLSDLSRETQDMVCSNSEIARHKKALLRLFKEIILVNIKICVRFLQLFSGALDSATVAHWTYSIVRKRSFHCVPSCVSVKGKSIFSTTFLSALQMKLHCKMFCEVT